MWAARIAASNAWRKPRKHSGNTPLPSVCIYTPGASYTFPSNVWAVGPVGGTGGQGRRRKEVSSRFIDYGFWLSADKTIFGKPQKCIPLGGELLLWSINSWQVKNLKMYMKHRGELGGLCSFIATIWMTRDNIKFRKSKCKKSKSEKVPFCEFRKVEESKSKNGLCQILISRKIDFLLSDWLNFCRMLFQLNMRS